MVYKFFYFRSKIRYFWLIYPKITIVYQHIFVNFWKIISNLHYDNSQILLFSFKNSIRLTYLSQNHGSISTNICIFKNYLNYTIMIFIFCYFRSKIWYFWLTYPKITIVYRHIFVIFWKSTSNLTYNDSQKLCIFYLCVSIIT